MTDKKSMPPELLAHFKKKNEKEGASAESKAGDKERRRAAVKKARVRLEESKRGRRNDKKEKAGKGSTEAS